MEKNIAHQVDLPDGTSLVLFDGVCNFCEGSVRFIIDRDPAGRFRFASLQSDLGRSVLERDGRDSSQINSLILLENGKLYDRSSGALRIARHLRFPWSMARIFLVLPRFLRDPFYNLIARNRYRWFGKKEECMIPTPEIRGRFLA